MSDYYFIAITGFSMIAGLGLAFLLWTYTPSGKRWLKSL